MLSNSIAGHQCEWGEGAKERWKGIEDWQLEYMFHKPEHEGLVGRTAEQTLKIATVRAISRDSVKPIVEIEDVEFGYAIVRRSIVTIDEGVRKHMSGSPFHALCQKLLGYIKAAGAKGMAQSALMRKQGVKAAGQMFTAAIAFLLGSKEIVKATANGGTTYTAAAGK